MSQDTSTFDAVAKDAVSFASDECGDIQRHIVSPAMLEVIGAVNGKDILDLFCGAGYLSRRLAALGAAVTAVDSSERLIGIASEINTREKQNIRFAVAEPTELSVIEDSTFDDIVCNMGIMMSHDLAGTISELARLVKLGGRFVFSVLHPCFCMPDSCWANAEDGKTLYKTVDDYFTEGWWPSDLASTVRSSQRKIKHRTLTRYVNALSARGFTVRRLAEPRPSPEVLKIKPRLEVYDRVPVALIVEAVFPYL